MSANNPVGLERALVGFWLVQSGLDDLADAKSPARHTCHTQAARNHERECEACTLENVTNAAAGMSWTVNAMASILEGYAQGMPAILDRLRAAFEEYDFFEVSSSVLAATLLRLNDFETGPLVDDEADEPATIQFAGREPYTAA
jgi:hypothetical protein